MNIANEFIRSCIQNDNAKVANGWARECVLACAMIRTMRREIIVLITRTSSNSNQTDTHAVNINYPALIAYIPLNY